MKKCFLNVLIALLSFVVASAEDKTDFLVNDDNSTAIQKNPKIAVAQDRSFVITWVDRRNDNRDIYVQRFDANAEPVGRNKLVNDNTNGAYQFDPAIAVDYSGNYSIIWKDYRTNGYPYNPEMFTQRYDGSLTPLGINTNLSVEEPSSTKESPDISLFPSGKGVVVWADYRNYQWDIYGQLVDVDGSLIGNNFKVNHDNTLAQQHSPKVSVSSQGWFVVTWYDNRYGNDDIFVRRFDENANPLTADISVCQDYTGSRQAFSDVATDGKGHFTVVWVDWRNGVYPSNPDIYSRKYDTLLNPITGAVNINTDNSNTAQRDPVIAADRLGNVAIIWADSINKSWDIAGQMIDVDGVIRETNFKANSFTDSMQFSPDVALDGKYRYLTWADRRNGNFDIYASIQKYNDPSLVATPSMVRFEMREGGLLPDPQSIYLDHVGYNPLPYAAVKSDNWFDVSPKVGATPDSVAIWVTVNTLPLGLHTGEITFVDTYNNDSSITITVQFEVTMPTMTLSDDTLYYTVFEKADDNYTQSVTVENEFSGQFQWNVSEQYEWLTLSTYSGYSSEAVTLTVNASNLMAGLYNYPVVFNSPDARGAPDTLILSLEVVNDVPYIDVMPDSLFLFADDFSDFDTTIQIINPGSGELDWYAVAGHYWLKVSKLNMVDNDSLVVNIIDTLLTEGLNVTWIQIIDEHALNQSVKIPFVVYNYQSSLDSVVVTSTSVEGGTTGSVSVICKLQNPVTNITLPLRYTNSMMRIDSILNGVSNPGVLNMSSSIDEISGRLNLEWHTFQQGTYIPIGESHLAEIYFTAYDHINTATFDTVISDQGAMSITATNGKIYMPSFGRSNIIITASTPVEELSNPELPITFELSQNYPNPFNLETYIQYQIPSKSHVVIEVFNLLGQKVATLADLEQSAGYYEVGWNGQNYQGSTVASGIYLYRIAADDNVETKKMVLLK